MLDFITKVLIAKFIKFAVVGFSGLLIDFGTTWILKEKAGVQKYIANGIGFIVAASTNYFLNRIWTFQSHDPQIGLEYSKFLIVSIVGLALNTGILWILVQKFKWNFYFSKLVAIVIVTLWNFIANYLYTFA